MSDSFLSQEECVAELQRVAGVAELEAARRSLGALVRTDPAGAERARRLLEASGPGRTEHVVAFYEDEAFLQTAVVDFVLAGFREDETVVVVVTEEHRRAYEEALLAAAPDLEHRRRLGRYLELDARATLARLAPDGQLDADRYRREVGGLLDRLTAGGRQVRLYGEMVALLWDQGRITTALDLEDRWNEVAARFRCSVLCSYPMSGFDSDASTANFHEVCERHTGVATESYGRLDAEGEPGSLIVLERDEAGGRRSSRWLR